MSRVLLALVAIAAGALGCDACAHAVVVHDPVLAAADASDVCAAACGAAAACSCGFASNEAQCEIACRRDQAQGSAAQLAPACLAEAGTCAVLRACAGVAGGCP